MSKLDLNTLSLAELKQLNKEVTKAISEFSGKKKSQARAALEAQAKELGFSLSDLIGGVIPKTRASAPPKYRNPQDADVTWSGRGRKPLWFDAALAAGKSPDQLGI